MTSDLASLRDSVRIIGRHFADRLRYPRGTRLVMGNALVARLLYSLSKQAQVTLALETSVERMGQGTDGAVQSLVLLHNPRGVLPLAPTTRRLALIGEDAATVRLGGYSGPGVSPVAVREALTIVMPTAGVRHVAGPGRTTT